MRAPMTFDTDKAGAVCIDLTGLMLQPHIASVFGLAPLAWFPVMRRVPTLLYPKEFP